jgi:hypothetical protein
VTKAFNRKLIKQDDFGIFMAELTVIGKMLNNYIKSIGKVSEPDEPYGMDELPYEDPTTNDQ